MVALKCIMEDKKFIKMKVDKEGEPKVEKEAKPSNVRLILLAVSSENAVRSGRECDPVEHGQVVDAVVDVYVLFNRSSHGDTEDRLGTLYV